MKNNEWTAKTAMAKLIHDVAGYNYDKTNDGFTARTDPPVQSNLGYTCFYDLVSPLANMVIDCTPITFEYDDCKWLVEMWKGQYGMLTGCEIGYYTHPTSFESSVEGTAAEIMYKLLDTLFTSAADLILNENKGQSYSSAHKLFYCCLGQNDLAKALSSNKEVSDYIDGITFKLNKNGETICSYIDKQQFWVNGFEIEENVSYPSELEIIYEFKFNDIDFGNTFLNALKLKYPNNTDVDSGSFTFKHPEGSQPYVLNRIFGEEINLSGIMKKNQTILSAYNQCKKTQNIDSNDPNDFPKVDIFLTPFFVPEMAISQSIDNSKDSGVSINQLSLNNFISCLPKIESVNPFVISIVKNLLETGKYELDVWKSEYEKFASMMKSILNITDINAVGDILHKLDFPQETIGKIFYHVYDYGLKDILNFFNIKLAVKNIGEIKKLLESIGVPWNEIKKIIQKIL